MALECNGCGNKEAFALRVRFLDGKSADTCDKCANVSGGGVGIPDVYWPGGTHTDSNIVDKMGNPVMIESRRHKAQLLKERGMREAMDRVKGGPSYRFNGR